MEYALKKEFDISLKKLTIKKNEFGKPYMEEYQEVDFNISHCNHVIACGIGPRSLGIDVEEIRNFDWRVAKRICSEEELQSLRNSSVPERVFFSYWVLKESLGKAMGVGLNYSLKDVSFRITKGRVWCSLEQYEFKIREINSRYLLAVCLEKRKDYNMRRCK